MVYHGYRNLSLEAFRRAHPHGATVGGASTSAQSTRTHGLTAPRRLDLQRRWRHKCTPAPDQFSWRGAKRRFMTANAGGEPRPMAEATQERRLLGVGSSAWF